MRDHAPEQIKIERNFYSFLKNSPRTQDGGANLTEILARSPALCRRNQGLKLARC